MCRQSRSKVPQNYSLSSSLSSSAPQLHFSFTNITFASRNLESLISVFLSTAKMKKSGLLAASIAAASATAASASSSTHSSHQDGMAERRSRGESSSSGISSSSEKFAPRFDGLRFIETLITAHR